MTRKGLVAAINYSNQLPEFENLDAAREALTKVKDETLRQLIDDIGSTANLDYSTDSLKRLERSYFDAGCPETGKFGYSMPHGIGFYLGEVLCKTAKYQWTVMECFLQSGRYHIGVNYGHCTIMLMRGRRHVLKGNVRMQSLWRECKKYSSITC